MIYIDQPISVGFSYGSNNVDSTTNAAPLVWKLLQAFYVKFPQYKSRDFGIFTESYGGHYGPAFTKYILDQNDAIDKNQTQGAKINFIALGINNGWINPYDNYKGMIDYGVDNGYKQVLNQSRATSLTSALKNQCYPALQKCWADDTVSSCTKANSLCKRTMESPLTRGNFNVYDIRKPAAAKWPPQTYEKFLQQPDIQSSIGASRKYDECPNSVMAKFSKTGDGTCLIEFCMIEQVLNMLRFA
jgi:carboxypeptidase C (cathepsin A)